MYADKDTSSAVVAIKVGRRQDFVLGRTDNAWLELTDKSGFCLMYDEDRYLGTEIEFLRCFEHPRISESMQPMLTFRAGDSIIISRLLMADIAAIGRKGLISPGQVGRIAQIDSEGDVQIDFLSNGQSLWMHRHDCMYLERGPDLPVDAFGPYDAFAAMPRIDSSLGNGPCARVCTTSGKEILRLANDDNSKLCVRSVKRQVRKLAQLGDDMSIVLMLGGRTLRDGETIRPSINDTDVEETISLQVLIQKHRPAKPDGDWDCPAPCEFCEKRLRDKDAGMAVAASAARAPAF